MKHLKSSSRHQDKEGFALLITLVVVSVVLAIGLSLLFVTTKQYLLAVTAIESEKAFQAGQIGLECMRYHRVQADTRTQFLAGNAGQPTLPCGGSGNINPQVTSLCTPGECDLDQRLFNYRYSYDLSIDGSNVCVEPSLYIADLRSATTDMDYPISSRGEGLGSIECTAGTICTAIFARGYNRPCDQLDSIFTIQREITVEF